MVAAAPLTDPLSSFHKSKVQAIYARYQVSGNPTELKKPSTLSALSAEDCMQLSNNPVLWLDFDPGKGWDGLGFKPPTGPGFQDLGS